ncbi:MAG: EAL domain-containing protein [Ferrovum sp.]|nr:EAL domain-containing protein [Ferrovum sp.]
MPLKIVDCLAPKVERVLEEDRALHHRPEVLYAVFKESITQGPFCGMVTAQDVALHPDWIFADLSEHRPVVALPPNTVIDDALALMNDHGCEVVAVMDGAGQFLGAVSRTSLLHALLHETKRMYELIEKDNQQLSAWSLRLSSLSEASSTLLKVLAHSAIESDLLQTGIEALASLLQARYGAIGILSEAGGLKEFVYTGIPPESAKRIDHPPEGKGLLGAVIRENSAIRIEHITQDPRSSGFPPGHPPMTTLLAVPISHLGHIYGRIYLTDKVDGTPFTTNDESLTLNFANTLSLVLDKAREIKQIRHQQQQLDYMAHFDALTELPNRGLLSDRITQAMAQAQRQQHKAAALFIDLDNFKHVNDSLGHAIGDRLLQAVSRRMLQVLREGDTLARLGGDEFVILLPIINEEQDAATVAQKVLSALEPSFDLETHEVYASASIGISVFPTDAPNMDALLAHADTAMYHAKSQGKSHYQFFAPNMAHTTQKVLKIESCLRHALKRNEFLLHYQPQVKIDSQKIVGMEALLRWNSEELGQMSPIDFIPLAEASGQIIPIGEWVLQQACVQGKKWLDAGVGVRVAVNLSVHQFQRDTLRETVMQALRASGLPPTLLELEITESVLMENVEAAVTTLEQIKGLGVRISMDDFGTGYSSLSYLQRLPLNTLKIDQSFVRNIPENPNDIAIVAAIIAMASQFNLEIIAEGVETNDQMEFLRAHGCHCLQGYYFSHPLTPNDATNLLAQAAQNMPPMR